MKRNTWIPVVIVSSCLGLGVACGSSKSSEKPATDTPAVEQAAVPTKCDLFKQDCPEGQGCMVASGEAVCVPAGQAAADAACQTSNDCVKGTVCGENLCRPLCDKDHPCAKGSCTIFTNMPAFPDLGACT
jgi:hypothetical protein